MPVSAGGETCGSCRRRRRVFDAAFAPYRYEFPLVQLIHRFKYGGQIAIGRILGTLLARRFAERGRPCVDAIVPVPLHPARRRRAMRFSSGMPMSPPANIAISRAWL
jgi:predicted amidophosphoribosyltransferase